MISSNASQPGHERREVFVVRNVCRERSWIAFAGSDQDGRATAPDFRHRVGPAPCIGDLPVADIDTPLVLKVLEPIWQTKTETDSRVRGRIERVLSAAARLPFHVQRLGERRDKLPRPSVGGSTRARLRRQGAWRIRSQRPVPKAARIDGCMGRVLWVAAGRSKKAAGGLIVRRLSFIRLLSPLQQFARPRVTIG